MYRILIFSGINHKSFFTLQIFKRNPETIRYSSAFCSLFKSDGSSKSRYIEFGFSLKIDFASVVLPAWREPTNPTTGNLFNDEITFSYSFRLTLLVN